MLSPLESAEGILVTAAIRDISLRNDAEEHLAAQGRGTHRSMAAARAMSFRWCTRPSTTFLPACPTGCCSTTASARRSHGAAPREAGRGAVPRPGRLQAHQRFARPLRRRQAAAIGRASAWSIACAPPTLSAGRAATSSWCCSRRRSNAEDAAIVARRMLEAVAEAHSIDEHELHVTTSIGVSVYPDDGRTPRP